MFEKVASPALLHIAPSGILAFLDALQAQSLEVHGLVMLRHGQVACSAEFPPYDTHTPHVLFSLSKSFTSTAVGFAVSEGLLALDDLVLSFFPDKAPAVPDEGWQHVTVADLLCMGSGLAPESDTHEDEDWVAGVLRYPILHTPGTHFHYNSMGTYLCSAIVQRVTGQTLRDYLMPRLFTPLGMGEPEWDCCPAGINCGGWGLYLSTMDIARFGQLLLQDGQWEGKQLLPQGWVQCATEKKIDNFTGNPQDEWQQGYGYQFWRCRDNHFRGDGMFGQVCWVMPEQDAVLAMTCGMEDMGAEFACVHDFLIPAINQVETDPTAATRLAERLQHLDYPIPQGPLPAALALDGTYESEEGQQLILVRTAEGLHVDFALRIHVSCTFGIGAYHSGQIVIPLLSPSTHTILAACGWEHASLQLILRIANAPVTCHATLSWQDTGLIMEAVGPGFTMPPTFYRCLSL